MLRVNGLFGWVEANDQRSLVLFGGFVLALQFAAALALYLPLGALDPAHAPFDHWGGYAVRYIPIVAVVGVVVFAAQMAWHVHSVRKFVAFNFVDHQDEPRLCDIVEALAIGMGLPAPYVGVIESGAMNAFACGVRRSDAVVVVTRGLINGLDDEELAAVVAHELAHIANGDIRLMAAANVCLGMLRVLVRPNRKKVHPLVEIFGLPVTLFVMPPMFVAVLLLAFLSQVPVRAGHMVRRLIGASREFVADAAAVEATQNPAALVSALRRIEGRSLIAGMPPGEDAMMIDGAAAGAFATHPTIGERIKALIAVTGSMALIAPSRRDTRASRPSPGGFGRRMPAAAEPAELAAPDAHDVGYGGNWIGLSRPATLAAALAFAAFIGWRGVELRDPRQVMALFDPRPATTMVTYTMRQLTCGVTATVGVRVCDVQMNPLGDTFTAKAGLMGPMVAQMKEDTETRYRGFDGVLANGAPPEAKAAEVTAKRCFTTDSYSVGQFGLHPLKPARGDDPRYDIDRWLASGDDSARAVLVAPAPDAALAAYVEERKERTHLAHKYFGEGGLRYAVEHFGAGDHRAVITILNARLGDPRFTQSLDPATRAEMQLLAREPDAFVPCRARQTSG